MMHFCVIIIAVPVLIIMNFHLKDMIILFVLYLFIGMPISIIFSYLLTFLCLYLGVKLRRKKCLLQNDMS
ncbi:MAG: hypothetical protein HWD59_11610 [Coxiellaceae bacterium]|nr:MAG: hypothetical protein HWD59_11610 [Coxiellaceae bacterium]